jgi:Phosphate-selective porin O and P
MNRTKSINTVRPMGRTKVSAGTSAPHQLSASHGRSAARFAIAAVLGATALSGATVVLAEDVLPQVSVGGGMRTSFADEKVDGAAKSTDDFDLDSVRLYVNGSVTNNIKFTFNTEYTGDTGGSDANKVEVLDAIARFEYSDEFNIWAGRFLPPSDRANLHGPYYSNEWSTYIDGVQDGYASVAVGRDNGVAYWGQFFHDMLSVSGGAFSVPSTFGTGNIVWAERVMVDLWDPEKGYYLNGTYYGDKDILALGVAGQQLAKKNAYDVDFLMEKKFGDAGTVSVQGEYAKYEFGGYTGTQSDGGFGLISYLFPQVIGIGKFELLAKYAKTTYDFDDESGIALGSVGQKTDVAEIGYVIKEFSARVSLFYNKVQFDANDISSLKGYKLFGVGLQLQM